MLLRIKFIIDESQGKGSAAYIDLLLLDLVIKRVLASHDNEISIWRIHRRFGPHRFGLDIVCEDENRARIEADIQSDAIVEELKNEDLITDIEVDSLAAGRSDINDKNWPPVIQQAWPEFAQGFSSMLLQMTELVRAELSTGQSDSDILKLSITEKADIYVQVQKQIDKLWLDHGSHAYLHHIHALFGYRPFRSFIMSPRIIYEIK